MTNGEKIKEIFPSIELYEKSHDDIQINFNSIWWNAEYKEPSSSEKPNKSEIPTSSDNLSSGTRKNSEKLEKDFGESDCISRQAVQTRLKEIINEMETIFANIREREVDDAVCGLCEYDCDHGLDGYANECPGFEKDDCFKLNEKYKAEWLDISNLPSVTPQEPRWISVSERVAEFPCLACDIYEQIFIPVGVIRINNRCFDGKDFDFDVEKFLKGKEVTLFGGEKVYELPREIVAWMPLPAPFEPQESEDKE